MAAFFVLGFISGIILATLMTVAVMPRVPVLPEGDKLLYRQAKHR